MIAMMEELKDMLRYVFQTNNAMTFPVSGPGSLGMEACVNNMVEPGDKAIIAINGVFGTRMAEVTRRAGAEVITVENEWGTPVDPGKVETALKANPDVKHVGFVHAETSTGVLSDAAAICKLAQEAGAFSIVDTVTSLAGVPVQIDVWGGCVLFGEAKNAYPARPAFRLSLSAIKPLPTLKIGTHPCRAGFWICLWCLPIGKEMARGLTITPHR